jgi:hypothetical protein
MAQKPGLYRVFLWTKDKISTASIDFFLICSISGIASPQSPQNLVNYHPIFCPNAGDCSFFAAFCTNASLRVDG